MNQRLAEMTYIPQPPITAKDAEGQPLPFLSLRLVEMLFVLVSISSAPPAVGNYNLSASCVTAMFTLACIVWRNNESRHRKKKNPNVALNIKQIKFPSVVLVICLYNYASR